MATVKDLAAYVCDKLAGKVLIHRYDAYSTNSVYLKFDYGLGNSLRLSDHTGKAGLNYRFNIITTMKSLGIDTSGEYPRFYYPAGITTTERPWKPHGPERRANVASGSKPDL